MLRARLKKEIRTNTYQEETGDLIMSPMRAEAVDAHQPALSGLFGSDPKLDDLREKYAIPEGHVKDPAADEGPKRLFLLVNLGLRDQPSRREHHLHE